MISAAAAAPHFCTHKHQMMAVFRLPNVLALLLVLISALNITGAVLDETLSHEHRQLLRGGGGGGGRGSSSRSSTFSRPSSYSSRPSSTSYRPVTSTSTSYRPTTSAAASYRPAASVAAAGSDFSSTTSSDISTTRSYGGTTLPGGFSQHVRPGYDSTPYILPLGSSLLAAGAANILDRDPTAYCGGASVRCYRAACQEALRNRYSLGVMALSAQVTQWHPCLPLYLHSVDVLFCSGQSTAHANRQSASHDWARVLLPSGFADDPLVSITNTSMFVVSRCPQAAAAADAALGKVFSDTVVTSFWWNNTLILSACPDTRYTECYR